MKVTDKVGLYLTEQTLTQGWWICRECSNENWNMCHKPEEETCPKSGKPRKECEISRKELGLPPEVE